VIRQIRRDKQWLVVTDPARVGWRTADVVQTIEDLAGACR
jgi:hypothetical protein